MKKFIGAICSALAGILTFVWLSLDWFAGKRTAGGKSETEGILTGYEIISGKQAERLKEIKGYTLTRIFAIVMMVVAIICVAMAVVMLLKNLGVLKFNFNMSLVNNILLAALVVCTLVAIIGLFVMNSKMKMSGHGVTVSYFPAVGAWLQLVVGAAACGCGWALARKD